MTREEFHTLRAQFEAASDIIVQIDTTKRMLENMAQTTDADFLPFIQYNQSQMALYGPPIDTIRKIIQLHLDERIARLQHELKNL